MADANVSKIGLNSAVEAEKAAAAPEAPVVDNSVAPNIAERRVVGRKEVKVGEHVIVVENL